MSTFRLVLVPGIITAAVTLLRLTGELNHWSRTLFNPDAGGGLALVGIAWLVPIFGIYFAMKLQSSGHAGSGWRAVGFGILAIAAFVVVAFAGSAVAGIDPNQPTIAGFGLFVLGAVIALAIAYYGAGTLGSVLFAYGLAARIPVILVMLIAILGNWGTHYDVPPPGAPEMGVWAKWLFIGVVPQLTLWMAFTVAVGAIFGGLALVVAERRQTAVRTA
jgi:hypothetical protein